MVELRRSRSESTRPRIGVRNAAFPDVHVPIVIGGPLTPAHQQVRLRSRSKPVPLSPAALSRHLGVSVATFMLLLDISAQAARRSTGGQCLKPSRDSRKA